MVGLVILKVFPTLDNSMILLSVVLKASFLPLPSSGCLSARNSWHFSAFDLINHAFWNKLRNTVFSTSEGTGGCQFCCQVYGSTQRCYSLHTLQLKTEYYDAVTSELLLQCNLFIHRLRLDGSACVVIALVEYILITILCAIKHGSLYGDVCTWSMWLARAGW